MRLIMRPFWGGRVMLLVSSMETVERLKEHIQGRFKVPIEPLRIIFRGKQLEDERTLTSYNIQMDDFFDLNLRLRGD